jgi:L-2-hydroxyglutarate oxidase
LTYKGFLNFFATIGEFLSSLSKRAFVAKSKKLIPDLEEYMFIKGGTVGVRAQAISPKGGVNYGF